MSTYISTISACSERDEVLALLDVFLNDFTESGFACQVPLELRPSRIQSVDELETWSTLVLNRVQRHETGRTLSDGTLSFLGAVLDAANRRAKSFGTT